MSIPSISALPTAPSTGDLSTFSARMSAWISAFTNTTVAEQNAMIAAINSLALADQQQSSAYDTTAGALLSVGAFGLGAEDAQTISDLDTATSLRTGFYRIAGSATANKPGTLAFGTCIILRYNSGAFHQIAIGSAMQNIWIRYFSTPSFTNWFRVYTDRNILGTVSQTTGLPTGSIIERGSGANGQYVRFADGTQICTHSLLTSSSAAQTWTYQASFASLDSVQVTATTAGQARMGTTNGPGNNSNVGVNLWNTAGSRVAEVAWLMAVGRWFT